MDFTTDAKTLGPSFGGYGFQCRGFSRDNGGYCPRNMGGNMRGMRHNGAKGSSDALLQSLGITQGQVDDTASSFDQYGGKVKETAKDERNNIKQFYNGAIAEYDKLMLDLGQYWSDGVAEPGCRLASCDPALDLG